MIRLIILLTSLWVFFYCSIIEAFAQGQNCNNPIVVSPCPTVSYTSVSTAGMVNDVNAIYYTTMAGNDIVYKIVPLSGNSNVLISIKNLSANAFMMVSSTPCTLPYYSDL